MADVSSTLDWWRLLTALAVLNFSLWLTSACWLRRHPGPHWPVQRLHLILSALYVLGCGYRSVLPVFDVPRVVLVDSFASSVLVGRSVATLAELSFAAQAMLLLRGVSLLSAHAPGLWVARAVLPLIGIAELHSWGAVLTTNNLGHVVEESLWGLCALLAAAALAHQCLHAPPARRRWMAPAIVAALAYAAYMFSQDVPMYWARWLADEAAGKVYASVSAGLVDAATRWTVSAAWSLWRSEVVWMTAYFSVAVWLSIAVAHARLPARTPA